MTPTMVAVSVFIGVFGFAAAPTPERIGVPPPQSSEQAKPKRVEIAITADGFTPSTVDVERGVPIELIFTRRTEKTCATEVAVPALKIKKALPLNEPVTIALTPEKEITFSCGMNMLKGKLVVK